MSRKNYTDKNSNGKRSCDFDASMRVRVYYITLTTSFFVKKEVDFVCLRYAKTTKTGFAMRPSVYKF